MIKVFASEIIKFRALLQALIARHVATRYRGSALGFLWSLMNPLVLILVYTLVFHYYLRFEGVQNYPLVLCAGLLPWLWTSSAIMEGTSSVVSSGHLITKSMFPAQVLPLVSVVSTGINFLLSLPILFLFMLVFGMPLPASLLLLPALILLHGLFLYGIVLALASLNVFYRDVQHIAANALSILFFLCPIVYPISSVPERFRFLVDWNPLAIISECYRSLILYGQVPSLFQLSFLAMSTLILLFFGIAVHESRRERFAEAL